MISEEDTKAASPAPNQQQPMGEQKKATDTAAAAAEVVGLPAGVEFEVEKREGSEEVPAVVRGAENREDDDVPQDEAENRVDPAAAHSSWGFLQCSCAEGYMKPQQDAVAVLN